MKPAYRFFINPIASRNICHCIPFVTMWVCQRALAHENVTCKYSLSRTLIDIVNSRRIRKGTGQTNYFWGPVRLAQGDDQLV